MLVKIKRQVHYWTCLQSHVFTKLASILQKLAYPSFLKIVFKSSLS